MEAITVESVWCVEAQLEPIRDAVGKFERRIRCVIGDQSAWKFRVPASLDCIVEMVLRGPFADVGNLSIVDLDLVISARARRQSDRYNPQQRPENWTRTPHITLRNSNFQHGSHFRFGANA